MNYEEQYYLLSKNIERNKFDNNISAYCIALNDSSKLDTFFMESITLGGALNSFGVNKDFVSINARDNAYKSRLSKIYNKNFSL